MALNKPDQKLKGSLSHYIFARRDLQIMRKNFPWKILAGIPAAVIKSEKDYNQKFVEILLSVLANHIEITRQAFYEHFTYLNKPLIPELESLGNFLFDLRNTLSHTRGSLQPKWDAKPKSNTFQINIPVNDLSNFGYNPKGSTSFKYSIKIVPGKILKIDVAFFLLIELLSFHILQIIKQQKISSIQSYLNSIPSPSTDWKKLQPKLKTVLSD
jgi:hypothetical protein